MDEHVTWYRSKQIERTAAALEHKGFTVHCAATRDEAKQIVASLIKPGEKVGWGGSATLTEIGILGQISELGAVPMIPEGISSAERLEYRRQALHADVYLTGCNAVSEDGQLVNIDGTGNRLASMLFGPRVVVMVFGRNKICADLDSAINRVHEVAAPMNCHRLDLKTACTSTGTCHSCANGICNVTQIIHKRPGQRPFHIVIVDDDLGY
jgi:L-lactate utilization protein LutB